MTQSLPNTDITWVEDTYTVEDLAARQPLDAQHLYRRRVQARSDADVLDRLGRVGAYIMRRTLRRPEHEATVLLQDPIETSLAEVFSDRAGSWEVRWRQKAVKDVPPALRERLARMRAGTATAIRVPRLIGDIEELRAQLMGAPIEDEPAITERELVEAVEHHAEWIAHKLVEWIRAGREEQER